MRWLSCQNVLRELWRGGEGQAIVQFLDLCSAGFQDLYAEFVQASFRAGIAPVPLIIGRTAATSFAVLHEICDMVRPVVRLAPRPRLYADLTLQEPPGSDTFARAGNHRDGRN